jgi:hypothetical protein
MQSGGPTNPYKIKVKKTGLALALHPSRCSEDVIDLPTHCPWALASLRAGSVGEKGRTSSWLLRDGKDSQATPMVFILAPLGPGRPT